MSKPVSLRPAVQIFAYEMEERLLANDWKGGWEESSDSELIAHLFEEAEELVAALREHMTLDHIASEAADLANIAMMLADPVRLLRPETTR